MKGPAKLSVRFNFQITYEMMVWLDDIARQTGQTRSEAARALLQTIMDESLRDDDACNEPAQMPGGQGVGAVPQFGRPQ